MPAFDPLLLALKMAIAATIVVSVSVIAERSKPFIAAMIATLPVSAGPALVFLALDHDDAFMRETLTGAMFQNTATGIFCLAYAFAAQRFGTLAALAIAFLLFGAASALMRAIALPLLAGLVLAVFAYGILIAAARPLLTAAMPPAPPRPWYAIPMRALAVAALVALVTTLSWTLGPYGSGLLAVFPIVMSSLIVILHPRIGGPATARLIASGLPGLLGFAFALAAAALLAEPMGAFVALAIGFAITLLWNGGLVWLRRG